MKYARSGFTLMELMISISLCLLLCAISTVSLHFLQKNTVKAEMYLLISVCTYLQQQAIATREIQELLLDPALGSYSFNGHEHVLASGVCFDVALNAFGPPSAPYKLLQKPITFKDNKIIFYPEGMMSAGMICFTNSDHTMLYALSNAVAHVSYMRRYRYDGRWESIN